MYELLLTIHLLAAMIWVGGATALNVMATRAAPETRAVMVPHFEFFGNKVIGPTSGILLLAGFGLVAELDLNVDETWIVLALIGWVVSGIIGFAVLGRFGKEIGEAMTATPPDFARSETLYGKLLMWSRIDLLLVVLIVVDMVVKPGS